MCGALRKAILTRASSKSGWWKAASCLSSETVQGAALSLESVDNVHGGDGLSLGVLAIGDCITDDVLQEDLQDSTGLFVDETADPLYTTSSSETADGGLGDTLDVITQDLSMTLGASLSQAFSSFTASRHGSS